MKKKIFTRLAVWTAVILGVLGFLASISRLSATQQDGGRQQLEKALRRAAVACYAAEGIYPPNVEYLQQHYGIQIDESRYGVFYEVFAENLMPEITVVELQP